jgi:general stress protein CsbA
VSQSRSRSLLETVTSTAIGFAVSLVLTAAVLPAFGYRTTWTHDFWITCIFTVASVLRGYAVRRLFESLR